MPVHVVIDLVLSNVSTSKFPRGGGGRLGLKKDCWKGGEKQNLNN